MDDSRIIELFFERSEQAVFELSEKYGQVCCKMAESILGDSRDAEECVNDAYLAVWNTVPPARPDPLLTYVCRIVRNQAIKRYHSNTAAKRNSAYDIALEEIAECFPSSSSAEEEFEALETSRLINCFLAELDRQSRVMFIRRYWCSDSIEELAARFHTSRHYVSVRLSRIRKKLKEYLGREGVSL